MLTKYEVQDSASDNVQKSYGITLYKGYLQTQKTVTKMDQKFH